MFKKAVKRERQRELCCYGVIILPLALIVEEYIISSRSLLSICSWRRFDAFSVSKVEVNLHYIFCLFPAMSKLIFLCRSKRSVAAQIFKIFGMDFQGRYAAQRFAFSQSDDFHCVPAAE